MSAKHIVSWQAGGARWQYYRIIESCVWTCAPLGHLVSVMDDDDIALIRQLCTRVGCKMEDTSIVALIWDDGLSINGRLKKLSAVADDIHALVAAALTLVST